MGFDKRLRARALSLGVVLICTFAMPSAAKPSLTAFYVPWDVTGRSDLAAHLSAVDVFAPFWIALKTPDGIPTIAPDDETSALNANTRPGPVVMPVVSNAHDAIWDGDTADAVINKPESRTALIATLLKLAAEKKYGGYIFDLENLSAHTLGALPQFVFTVQTAFKASHLEIWVTVPFGSTDWPARAIQEAGATVVLMAYEQCWANSTPGPIAGDDWFGATLAAEMRGLDPSNTIIALGNYAYDWPKGIPAKALSVGQALQLAHDNKATVAHPATVQSRVHLYSDRRYPSRRLDARWRDVCPSARDGFNL